MSEGALAPARLIVAMTEGRLMGRANDLPWHFSEDLAHFKRSTVGATVVMGRLSFESIGGKPLPRRTNLVVSRSTTADGEERDGVRWFSSLPAACAWVASERPDGDPSPWILGGRSLFGELLAPLDDGAGAHASLGLPRPELLVVTWVAEQPVQDGDVLFPFDRAWIERHYEAAETRQGETPELTFVTYRLRS